MPCTTLTGNPLGSRSTTAWPPRCAVTVPSAPRASRSRSARSAAWKAGPAKRGHGPRRTTRHAVAACRPRSTSASGARSATVKPKSVRNRSARSRSGFSNSSQARPVTLISGLLDLPGCSPGIPPASLCSDRCGSCPGAWRDGAAVRAVPRRARRTAGPVHEVPAKPGTKGLMALPPSRPARYVTHWGAGRSQLSRRQGADGAESQRRRTADP